MWKSEPNTPERRWEENQILIRRVLQRVLSLRPNHIAADQFRDAVLNRVHFQFLRNVHTFRGENWVAWLYKLCRNEAENEVRELVPGIRSKAKPVFVSWEDLQNSEFTKPRNDDRRLLVEKLLEMHRQSGEHGTKSADAIEMMYYGGHEATEVAERLKTTAGYVNQLVSRDYKSLYKLSRQKFGVTGTDL